MYAADEVFWAAHIDAVREKNIPLLFCPTLEVCKKYGLWHLPTSNELRGDKAIPGPMSDDRSRTISKGHSGFQALNLAYHLEPARILLLGYDARKIGSRRHFHEDHPDGFGNPKDGTFLTWAGSFKGCKAQFEGKGIEVINCSPQTAITEFPVSRIGQWL